MELAFEARSSQKFQDIFNRTPLHWASQNGLLDVVKSAVEQHNADLMLCSQVQQSPFSILHSSPSAFSPLLPLPEV
jgi:ankyrin repeat protein